MLIKINPVKRGWMKNYVRYLRDTEAKPMNVEQLAVLMTREIKDEALAV